MSEIKEEIRSEMHHGFGLKLTSEQIDDIQANLNFKHFDTVERSECIDYIARKITNMSWPLNGDNVEYKKQFYKELEEKSKKLGYIFKKH